MTVLGIETAPEIVGFPGTVAPQCGICSEVTETNGSVEQPLRGWFSCGYLPHFDTEHPAGGYSARNTLPGAIQLGTPCRGLFSSEHPAGGYSAQNTLPGAIQLGTPCRGLFSSEHPAGGYLVKPLEGFSLGKIALSWKNHTAAGW
ncbi:MAG: hypothetical protein NTV33_00420 [Coprothermobacterota bacterium]|nr:hypothetical protein [Coprothermobacterota bacterium]